jgi:putative transposase
VRDTDELFRSQLLPRHHRASEAIRAVLPELYLQGLATGDFEPALRTLLGEAAPLSPASIVRLKAHGQAEYEAWQRRPVDPRYAYCWADGLDLKAGAGDEKTAVLIVIGVTADGQKELLAMVEGYRESRESWREVLRGLRRRGLKTVCLFIGDALEHEIEEFLGRSRYEHGPGRRRGYRNGVGKAAQDRGGLRLWAAVAEVYPEARHQLCWCQKMLNVLDKLPQRLQGEAKPLLRDVYTAPTRAETEERIRRFAQHFAKCSRAVASLVDQQEALLTYYDFPREHWKSLHTSKPDRVDLRPGTVADPSDAADAARADGPLPGLSIGAPGRTSVATHQRTLPRAAGARGCSVYGRG